MAKTLYDYWFVQFDFPDEHGKPYKSSGGKMVYNEELKREIPQGWGVEKLSDISSFKNGINYEKGSSGDSKTKIVNVRNVSSSTIFIDADELDSVKLSDNQVNNYLVDESMILITRSGVPGATRMVTNIRGKVIYSGFIIGVTLSEKFLLDYVFFYLKDLELLMSNSSSGTIMKNISQATLSQMVIVIPNKEIVKSFSRIMDTYFEGIRNIQKQNESLINLRDWLLPLLMNGQVKLRSESEVREEL
ncbi:restriction endonuclease subunit S [Streptococcus oricebi]|uniref:Restriction endonuclease subunit S n=2 Tax=Streptococcus oricebi TaxID=1547447 RepID=A0ABS5B650_9STRE|nr:restriction endonuclease subunit S [Streptococcus oricebi]